jgi:ABC-2 type transport system ATP-binding protein
MSQTIVKTNGLSKKYGERYAVEGVSVEIKKGQIYGLIGQNGAGKTTFIRMLTGLIAPTDGQIELFGESGAALGKARGRIGSIVEMPSLFPNMTAAENLEAQRKLAGRRKDNIGEMLELCGIADTGKKKVRNFSLGMRQRLGLAVALLIEPEFIVLDEPINGLDPKGIVENREMLTRLVSEKNITILISSHILTELEHLATNYGIIHEGRLIKQSPAKQLQAECRQYMRILTEDAEKAAAILAKRFQVCDYEMLSGGELRVFEQLDKTAEINRALVNANIAIQAIGVTGQDLESYFMNITGGALS